MAKTKEKKKEAAAPEGWVFSIRDDETVEGTKWFPDGQYHVYGKDAAEAAEQAAWVEDQNARK